MDSKKARMQRQRTIRLHSPLLNKKNIVVNPDEPLQSIADGMYLYHDGQRIDDTKSLSQLGLDKNDVIIHRSEHPEPRGNMRVYFRGPSLGQQYQLEVCFVWTFKKVAEMLAAAHGLDASKIIFFFAGRHLVMGTAFMDESGIGKDTMIHFILRNPDPSNEGRVL